MQIDFLLDYQTILANKAQPVHLAVRFRADRLGQTRPRPAAFCVVLDRSGSMEGTPLQQAKAAASLAVRNLRAEDLFALVVFDSEAQTLVPLQPPAQRAHLLRTIDRIASGASTNLTGGWMLGRDELCKAPVNAVRRLLLLSDGLLNCGIVEPTLVRQIVAEALEKHQIRTSCLGFGDGYNEELLAELPRVTNGTFHDAVKPESLPAIFAAELDGLQRITVQNLRLRIRRLDFCEAFVQLGEYPVVLLPDQRPELALGDLVSEEERIACFALEVLPLPVVDGRPVASLEGEELLELEILFDEVTAEKIVSRTVTQRLRIQATQNSAQMTLNHEVVAWVATQRAGKAMRDFGTAMREGRIDAAVALIEQTLANLRAYSGNDRLITDAVAALTELRRMVECGLSGHDLKSAHHRSSRYRKMSSSEYWATHQQAPGFYQPIPPSPEPPSAPPPNPPDTPNPPPNA